MENILLSLFITIIVVYIIFQRYNPPKPSAQVSEIKRRLGILHESYAHIPIYVDDSAYTINKKTIYICLQDSNTGQTYSINSLMYVTLHELAHILTRELEYDANGNIDEHGPNFKKNFYTLIEQAKTKGVYDPSLPLPQSYCGVSR